MSEGTLHSMCIWYSKLLNSFKALAYEGADVLKQCHSQQMCLQEG